MQKRAQVTTFMILGLVILFVVLSIYVVNEYVLKTTVQKETEKASVIPEQIKIIQGYMDQCLKSVSEEGLLLISRQGGYYRMNQSKAKFLTDFGPFHPLNTPNFLFSIFSILFGFISVLLLIEENTNGRAIIHDNTISFNFTI